MFYGKYHDIHRRNIESLRAHLPKDDAKLVCWANTVCNETISMLYDLGDAFPGMVLIDSNENVPKYKAMRRMYYDEKTRPETPWILWLDDDTYVTKPDWWKRTKAFIEATQDACYVGQRWYVHHLEGQWDFIKASSWFQGKEPEMLATRSGGKKPGVWFMTGGYVWLRTDLMQELNWPDERLNHNGGDTLLGEAVRQLGRTRHHFDYGVAVNKAKRRGRSEKPAGSKKNTRR
jgi:GT2 family glycosyltransferase